MPDRSVRIHVDRGPRISDDALIFAAEDRHGPLAIWVTILTWERLQSEAPDYCDGDDRRDHALGMVEVLVADLLPGTASDGTRMILVAD